MYSSQYSSEWRTQLNGPWRDYSKYSTYNYIPSVHLSPPQPNLEELVSKYIDSANTRVKKPLLITTVIEESKKVECLPENKNEYEECKLEKENELRMESNGYHKKGQQEMEIDAIEKSEGVNLLTHETNFVLVIDSLCMQES
ncbi:hypothetical protein M9H77_23035 [Catharanthus roseus]|uniref:Uncharacterized protein n=1 Tax=Catharanthus roseus TaxID=4058 RepID=A0ACC0ATD2_CATRO|nr:hypothetical protein M9H77_23035 [Catharanthus roseus]